MPISGLNGPYNLTGPGILAAVSSNGTPGAYALGQTNTTNNAFVISYVGRSDTDIAARLQNWVGSYPQFKFGYFLSAAAAFVKECQLYHDFNPPDNKVHPARPVNENWRCPVCKVFG
jgi:hypothetical protein